MFKLSTVVLGAALIFTLPSEGFAQYPSPNTLDVFSNLLVNVPAHSCQDLFDHFTSANLCNQTGFDVPKNGDILCTRSNVGCNDYEDTYCALSDCCEPSVVVTGICTDFFTEKGSGVCTDHGFATSQPGATECDGTGCTLSTCCSNQAPNCKALFSLIENNDASQSAASIVGDYSCNTGIWKSKVSDWDTKSTSVITDDFLRVDCCDIKQTCGVLYDTLDGQQTCENRGYGTQKEDGHHCDPSGNTPCEVLECCEEMINCNAFNFLANGLSTTGSGQLNKCMDAGYAYSNPLALSPCYNGECKHHNCCVRQLDCRAFSIAEDGKERMCQMQGYPFKAPAELAISNGDDSTECFRGICRTSDCCKTDCTEYGFGFDETTRECHRTAQTCVGNFVYLVNDVTSVSPGNVECTTADIYSLCDGDSGNCAIATLDVAPQQDNDGVLEIYRVVPSSLVVTFNYIQGSSLATGGVLTTAVASEADIIAEFPGIDNIYFEYDSVNNVYFLSDTDASATVYIADPSTFPINLPAQGTSSVYAASTFSSETNFPIAFMANANILTGQDA